MMAIVIILALGWSAATIAGAAYFLVDIWNDSVTSGLIAIGLGVPCAILMAALPWAFIAESSSPDLATLKKNEWACTAAHQVTTMIMAGKVLVPSTQTVCDQYGRAP